MVSSLKRIAKQLADVVKGGFANLPQAMLGIGKNIVQGLWKGISAMKDWALGKIKEFVGGIVGGIKNLLGIHSPSKVFAEIGGNITRGFSNGITENGGLAVSAIKNVSSQVGGVGISAANVSLPTIPEMKIPRVALGQVVPTNPEFSWGSTSPTQEDGIRQAVREEMNTTAAKLDAILQAVKAGQVIMVDKAVLGRTARDGINDITMKSRKFALLF